MQHHRGGAEGDRAHVHGKTRLGERERKKCRRKRRQGWGYSQAAQGMPRCQPRDTGRAVMRDGVRKGAVEGERRVAMGGGARTRRRSRSRVHSPCCSLPRPLQR